ncbi:neprilysin-2-like isoform X2 [Chironomus tepperi]
MYLTAIISIILISKLTDSVTAAKSNESIACNDICLTSGCVRAASKILEKMDENIDPCDDFFAFSCNQYNKNTNVPDDKSSVNIFSTINDNLKEQLRTIVTSPIEDNEIESFKNIKKLFKACFNESLIEEQELKPLIDIHNELDGWPVVKGHLWNESKWTWQQSVIDFKNYGFSTNSIFAFTVDIDLKNTSKRIISIDQPYLGLNREYLIEGLDNKVVQAYYSYQVDLAVMYGADHKSAEQQMREVLEFEFLLANISIPKEDRRDFSALYNTMTIKDLNVRYPYNNWLEYFNSLLPDISQVTEDEIINVSVPSFFNALQSLLEQTSKRTLANYIFWRATESSSTYLTKQIKSRKLQYTKVLTGKQQDEPRWKECMNLASDNLPIAVGALYVRKYFQKNSKDIAQEMLEGIRHEFNDILKTVPWMDDSTRTAAQSKMKKMIYNIGYPDELMNDIKLTEFYNLLKINENNFFKSILNVKKFEIDRSFMALNEPFNKSDWRYFSGASVVNAFYDPTKNSIEFPAGILQGHFFSADRPRYLNYGAIGVVIGHEITHLFDDQGSQFDLDGNLVDWWEEETKKAYLEKARCIIEQYGNYTEPNVKLNLNGINTQGENIADNGGVKEAYLAYQKFVAKNGSEKKLPGLKYTQNQLFWISEAQIWCSTYRPESMKLYITVNEHSPGQFRVLGPLSNMKEFSKDFNCPIGSKMNPVHKCEVW